jgi:C4-dicarboxylate-binding protein DctP
MSGLKSKCFWLTVIIALTGILALTLAGCAKEKPAGEKAPAAGEKEQVTTMRLASTLPVGHHITRSCDLFKKLVEERSNGRIKVEHYPAMQLYGDKDLVDVLPRGGVEIASIGYGFWTGLVPEFGLFDILSVIKDPEHSYRVQDDPEVRAILGKTLGEKANSILIGWTGMEARGPMTIKPVTKLEDWKGMKVRAHSEYGSYWFMALGASPVVISAGEQYQALQRGTVQGVMSGGTSYIQRKLVEVGKYVIDNQFLGYGAFALVMNKDAFNKLPKDLQEVILQAGKETTDFCRQEAHKDEEASWQQMAKMPNIQVIHLSDEEMKRWSEVTVPYQRKIFEERAGKETSDKLFARVEALREKK